MYYSDGDKYDGKWKNGEKEGKGITIIFIVSEIYFRFLLFFYLFTFFLKIFLIVSNFFKNFKKILGIYYFSDGDKYDGKYLNGKREGKGIILFLHYFYCE